jgi:inner membrane protein
VDVFTHALLGATTVRALSPRRDPLPPRHRLLIGGVAAAFPDLDFVAFLVDPLRFLADWHQGPTHSIVLLPVWAALIAALYLAIAGSRPRLFGAAFAASAIALATHVLSDLITVYGTALFYPLSDLRFSLGTTFVIDPVVTAILLAALGFSIVMERGSFARAGLLVLVFYVAGQAHLQQRALEFGRASAERSGLSAERMTALPQPFSPFNWKLIGIDDDTYHESYVNVAGHSPLVPEALPFAEVARAYRPPGELAWRSRTRFGDDSERRALVEQRWRDPRFEPFRRFAVYPALSRITDSNGSTCVWFTDLRYDLPALPDTFRYGFCRDAAGEAWSLYRLRYFSDDARQAVGPGD